MTWSSDYYEERDEEPGVFAMLSCGMISSTVAMVATYPLNLIRTRLQMSGVQEIFTEFIRTKKGETYTPNKFASSGGAIEMVNGIIREDGIKGLYRGMAANMMKVVPATSISYYVYGYLTDKFVRVEK